MFVGVLNDKMDLPLQLTLLPAWAMVTKSWQTVQKALSLPAIGAAVYWADFSLAKTKELYMREG